MLNYIVCLFQFGFQFVLMRITGIIITCGNSKNNPIISLRPGSTRDFIMVMALDLIFGWEMMSLFNIYLFCMYYLVFFFVIIVSIWWTKCSYLC